MKEGFQTPQNFIGSKQADELHFQYLLLFREKDGWLRMETMAQRAEPRNPEDYSESLKLSPKNSHHCPAVLQNFQEPVAP